MTSETSPPESAANHGVVDLIELLNKQCDLFRQLQVLSQEQAGVIANGQTESLLTVLASRQKLIDELTGLNSQLEPYRSSWANLYPHFAEADRKRIDALLDDVQALMQHIAQQDERDRSQLEVWQGKIGEELQRVGQVGQALAAYGGKSAPSQARFTDHQG